MTAARTARTGLALLGVSAILLAGCGRRGPLEPPGPAVDPADAPLVFGGTRPDPSPATAAPEDKPFILDWLI